MKTSTRKRLGVIVVVASLLAIPAFYLSGRPLVSLTIWQTNASADGLMALAGFELHGSLLAVCAAGFLGMLAIAWPQQRPSKPQS